MAFFDSTAEVYEYIGGVLRAARDHPVAGPSLEAAGVVVQLRLTDPDAVMTLRFRRPLEIRPGADDPEAELVVSMPADVADRYWRGDYNIAVGVSRGKVRAAGSLDTLFELASRCAPMFPTYRRMVAEKDRLRGS